jgi:ornithine cyclodeaminase
MLIIAESLVPELVSVDDAFTAVKEAFASYDREKAKAYPVVREVTGHRNSVFGIKSGFDMTAMVLGLKAGGYWPDNARHGRTNHQSTVLLFDPSTGAPSALVGANHLTGLRTGAASALATARLARSDAGTLGIIGAGVQAGYQLRATASVMDVRTVIAWDTSADNLLAFSQLVAQLGLSFVAAPNAEKVARCADVLVTVTPSTQPIVMKQWVRPGTHINAMGADTIGKQELASDLVACSSIYVDSAEQAASIGECQHAYRHGLLGRNELKQSLGGLASGRLPGRQNIDEITLFDGTGIALQDLAAAHVAVSRARERGLGTEVAM